MYDDGSGVVAEGSYYPTQELDEETCTAPIAILAITDELSYTSNLNAGLTIPSSNILGSIPDGEHDHPFDGFSDGVPIYAGATAGSFSLTQSDFFDLN